MRLPILFFTFWYLEAPKSLFFYLLSMSNAFAHMLSLPLFLKTFWKPLKNEYRGDLVFFSTIMGIVIKSVLLLIGTALLLLLVACQVLFYLLFLALPLLVVLIPFTSL